MNIPKSALFLESGRPNNLSFVCLYLSLYISFSIFGHFFFFFWHTENKICPNYKKEIYNDKYRYTKDRLFGLPISKNRDDIHDQNWLRKTECMSLQAANYFFHLKLEHDFNVCISFSNGNLEKYFGTRFDKSIDPIIPVQSNDSTS